MQKRCTEAPVAVAVDGVKYFGNDANVGQAFSYSATGNVFHADVTTVRTCEPPKAVFRQ